MNIDDIVKILIPPAVRECRDGVSIKYSVIDKLTLEEKEGVTNKLIELLQKEQFPDDFIVDTLVYLKAEKALPVLKELLEKEKHDVSKIILSLAIFELANDQGMADVALNAAKNITDKYQLIFMFLPLSKFNNQLINNYIRSFVNHPDYLIAYNAKQALGIL